MAKITQPNLPADLPENWNNSQYVSADGTVAGLTPKHGYNYLMQQVNNAQKAVNTLAQQAQTDLTSVEKQVGDLEQSVGGLEKGGFNATAQRTGTTVAITGPEGASTVTFLAPSNWVAGDTYTYNGQTLTLTDLNGQPVKNGWKQGAPVTLSISGSAAYFAAGASGDFLPLEGGTMTGPAVGAPGAIATPQFRNVQYGTEALTPGVSPLPQGTLYITPEADAGESAGKRTCRFVVGTSTAGWTEADCDYLCDGTADDVEINAAIQALPATGGEIVILDGTYHITAPILMDKASVTLAGNGAATIFARGWNGAKYGDAVIQVNAEKCAVLNLSIDGKSDTFTSTNSVAIYIETNHFLVKGIDSQNNGGAGILASSEGGQIDSCKITKSDTGISATGSSTVISNNIVKENGVGINFSGTAHVVASNIVTKNTRAGIQSGGFNGFGVVADNVVYSNGPYGIYLFNLYKGTVSGNSALGNDIGIYLSGTASEQNLIGNNSAWRGNGNSSDYTAAQQTISASGKNNLFVGNMILGKNYVDSGTGNTWANNKYQ